jgi:hypothetical protein
MSIWNEANEEFIRQEVEEKLRSKFEELLKPFIKPNDYILNNNHFDYEKCILRITKELTSHQHFNKRIDCGHCVRDLTSESYIGAKPYCTICHLHDMINEAESESDNWRIAVESALNIKADENHDPKWAIEQIKLIKS